MFRTMPSGAGWIRLSVTGVVCLSLAAAIWGQESGSERLPYQPPSNQQASAQDPSFKPSVKPTQDGAIEQPRFPEAKAGYTPITNDDPDFAPMVEVNVPDGQPGESRLVAKDNPYVLAFAGGEYAPPRGVDPVLLGLRKADPTGFTYGYVMLRGRMADENKVAVLKKLGVHILGAHTYQSYIAKIPLERLPQLGALPFVHWIGHARPDQKLEPRLLKDLQDQAAEHRYQVDISVFESDLGPASVRETIGRNGGSGDALMTSLEYVIPNGPMQKALEKLGFEFEHYTDVGNTVIFEGRATGPQILEMRKLDFVSYIEEKQIHHLNHDQTVPMISQDRVRGSFDGNPVTLGIIDTGVSNAAGGGVYKTHQDLSKQMVAWSLVSGENGFEDGHGHGTHVAGTMIGEGKADIRYMGNAPGVAKTSSTRFFVGRYFDSAGKPQGSVSTLYSAMRQTYSTSPRPRAINNSWGSDATTTQWIGSESGARTVDNYVYNYDQTYVFSSGNAGVGVGSPSSAKNALTVGAVVDHWSGTAKPGDRWPSSQYGTKDNRRKPEVMAPGSTITSCKTKTTNEYTNKSGTSMAAPHMSGIIASLIHRYAGSFDYQPHRIKAQAMAAATWQGNPGTSSGWWGAEGYGLIDSYKMNNGDPRYSWYSVGSTTHLTGSGKYFYSDITVPSDVTHAKLVLSFTEQACGSGASKARVCDVRLYVDIAPFTSGGNTGEYSAYSSSLTNLSIASPAFGAAIKGKQIRIKVYGQSIPSGYLPKAGWTLFYYRKPTTGTPTFNAYASPSKVKPGQEFYWVTTLTANTSGPEFSNVRIYPSFSSLFPIQYMYRYTLDKTPLLHKYDSGVAYPSSPYPSLSYTTSGGMTLGSGNYRYLSWRLKAPSTSNTYTLYSYTNLDPTDLSLSKSGSVCVDGQAPQTVAGLTSATHPANSWRTSSAFTATWSKPVDVGCAGIDGLAYLLSTSSTSVPTTKNISGAATSKSLTIGSTSGAWFHIRAIDAVGNLSASTSHHGPIKIDQTNPTVTTVAIDGGATYATSLNVTVSASASDSYSGPYRMRYSSNGSTWSGWYTYTTSARSYNLSSYGGSTAQGTKTVYVQVADLAGNVSSTAKDTIIYDSVAPTISSVVINSGATYTQSSTVSVQASGSGADYMQYSFDGSTWSGLYTYTTSTRSFSVGSFGGNTSQGTKTCYVRLRDAAGNYSPIKSDSIIYDSVAPVITTVSIDGGAAYTNSTSVSVLVLGSGSPVSVQYSFDGSTWSSWMSYTTGTRTLSLTSYGGNSAQGTKTLHARLRDAATNVSATKTDTIVYDTTAPVVTTVSIDGGATYTSSTSVGVQVLGSGSPTEVQYSFNGSTWSSWMSYTTGSRTLSVTSYGGNANTGTKTVYARLRDAALNVSTTKTDSILYYKVPTASSISGTTFDVIHDSKMTLTGSGFADVTQAYVGTTAITSQNPEDWHKGFFRKISDSQLDVYPPQDLAPGTYSCYVRNVAWKSASFNCKVVHNTTSKTGVPVQLQSGKVLHVYTHLGPKPLTTVSVLTLSASNKPLSIPGLIFLGHGGNVSTFIDPSFLIISPGMVHNPTTHTAHWAFATPPGVLAGSVYWQSVMFDAAKPYVTPIPVSTTDVVNFYK